MDCRLQGGGGDLCPLEPCEQNTSKNFALTQRRLADPGDRLLPRITLTSNLITLLNSLLQQHDLVFSFLKNYQTPASITKLKSTT